MKLVEGFVGQLNCPKAAQFCLQQTITGVRYEGSSTLADHRTSSLFATNTRLHDFVVSESENHGWAVWGVAGGVALVLILIILLLCGACLRA